MSINSRTIINKNKDKLKKDLQCDVLSLSEKIFTKDENDQISEKENDSEKIDLFLDILAFKHFDDLSLFIIYLKEWYRWLHDAIWETINYLKTQDPVLKVHTLGGIPNLPSKNVTRKQLVRSVEDALKGLEKSHYLVLHGMVGCGKTTLAVQALNNYDIITKSFKEQVFWITVGHEGAKDPLFLLLELNSRLPEPLVLSSNPKLATIDLTRRFIEKGWTDCLIVLDDVTDENVLDVFNFGAKFLITTKDTSIITEKRKAKTTFIKVNEGFTSDETAQFFAKSLKINETRLPHYVYDIHKCTKGHPFTLSLIVSQFTDVYTEDLLKNKERWEYIIKNVLSKENRRWFRRKTLPFKMRGLTIKKKKLRRSLSDIEIYTKPIESSLESFSDFEKQCFYKLAVFLEDINIKPEVLSILWGVDKYLAEQIMMGFVYKSLAVRKMNELQNSYVYGVHDIIADFLKKDLSNESEKILHQEFVEAYQNVSNNDWSKLPDDNYIFYYIGHHWKKAEMTEFFQIFFDLEFLEAKLKATGPADLIRDFNKYESFITNGDEHLIEKVHEYSNFVENFGVWISQGFVDIIQASLQSQHNSLIQTAGRQLALSKSQPVHYIQCSMPKNKIVPESLVLKDEKIVAICFGSSINEIIVALENRTIEVYNFKTKSIIRRFGAHRGRISCINMSPRKTEFLTASHDNTVRIWGLHSNHLPGDSTPPPRDRQVDYQDLFDTEIKGERPKHVLEHPNPLKFALFSRSGDLIASICRNGIIMLWRDAKILWDTREYTFKSVDFFNNDKEMVAADTAYIFLMDTYSGNIIKKFEHAFSDFISLRTLPPIGSLSERVFIFGTNGMTLIMNEPNSPFVPMGLPIQSQLANFCSVGPYIAISTEDKSLFIFNPENGSIVTQLPPQEKVVSFCVGESAILTGDRDGKILLYPLEALASPFTRIKWIHGSQPVLGTVDNSHTLIKVVVGDKVNTKEVEGTDRMDVSEEGDAFVTCSKTGAVVYHCQRDCAEEVLISNEQPPPTSVFLLTGSGEHVVIISYHGKETRAWTSGQKTFINLWGTRSLENAELIQFHSKQIIITDPPFTMWSLDGIRLKSEALPGPYCINKKEHLLAVSTITGLKVFQLVETGDIIENQLLDEARHIKLIAFSPSATKLASIESNGSLKIFYNINGIWNLSKYYCNDHLKKATSLAVSDTGTVCYGGDFLVSILSNKEDSPTTAILDPVYIVANPDGHDEFAIADKTGTMRTIVQNIIRGNEQVNGVQKVPSV